MVTSIYELDEIFLFNMSNIVIRLIVLQSTYGEDGWVGNCI